MSSHLQPLIPADRIEELIQLEPAIVIAGLVLGSWAIYKFFLNEVSGDRHRNLQRLFGNLAFHAAAALLLFSTNFGISRIEEQFPALSIFNSYVGLFTILSAAVVFVKVCRILMFEYLFLGHMKVGVPVLLVNLFTLLLSMVVMGWIVTDIFNVRLAPLLATSACVSIVLGLALQDTLGNLFAGVALQFDKPYEIDDWIEVQGPEQLLVGRVHEISWRATVLMGWSDELITIPNRVMSQAEVSNFSTRHRPIVRRQTFRLPFESSAEDVKRRLAEAARGVEGVLDSPSPYVLIIETTESWMTYRLIYFVKDYGVQFAIGDRVIENCMRNLRDAGLSLAGPRLMVMGQKDLRA